MRGDVQSHRDVQLHIIRGPLQRWTERKILTEQQNVTILTETTDSLNKLTKAPDGIRLAGIQRPGNEYFPN
jgi:hypothetical protein